MLETWVNQNSGSLNSPGVEAVGRMLRGELEQLGFKVEWIDMKAAGRAGHIVARHKGNGRGKRMLLIGHLDTVFEPDSSFQKWERKDDRGIGPGSGDDKGGMAVMIAALRAMKAAGTLKAADITVVLTGDEEDAGDPIEVTRGPLIAAGKWADVGARLRRAVAEGRPRHGRDRAAQLRQLDGDRQRPHRPFERRDEPELRRELRACADHRRLPARAWRGQADLQCRDDRRRRDGRDGPGPDPPQRDRQDQHHRRYRSRSRRPARHCRRSRSTGCKAKMREIVVQVAARHDGADQLRPRRLSADVADRRQSRAARPPQPR